MQEVIHLSFGPRANYLNAKFFDRQVSYFVYNDADLAKSKVNPAIRFSAGKKYTPRAIFCDFKNGFGRLPEISNEYMDVRAANNFKEISSVNPIYLNPGPKIEVWTSDLSVDIHPRSLLELQNWEASSALDGNLRYSEGSLEFTDYEQGEAELKALQNGANDDLFDSRLRPLMELSDNNSGFYLTTDTGAFGGVSSGLLEQLRDECPKQTIVSWLIHNETVSQTRKLIRSSLRSIAETCTYSDIVLPVPFSMHDPRDFVTSFIDPFETVALLSSLRNDSQRVTLSELAQSLNINGANIVSLGTVPKHIARCGLFPQSPSIRAKTIIRRPGYHNEEMLCPRKRCEWDSNSQERVYNCPEPAPEAVSVSLTVDKGPLNLRNLVQLCDSELKDIVYDLTDPYDWGFESDDDFD